MVKKALVIEGVVDLIALVLALIVLSILVFSVSHSSSLRSVSSLKWFSEQYSLYNSFPQEPGLVRYKDVVSMNPYEQLYSINGFLPFCYECSSRIPSYKLLVTNNEESRVNTYIDARPYVLYRYDREQEILRGVG